MMANQIVEWDAASAIVVTPTPVVVLFVLSKSDFSCRACNA
jgi:hypothetical protein